MRTNKVWRKLKENYIHPLMQQLVELREQQ
jgi:hypothetical protein